MNIMLFKRFFFAFIIFSSITSHLVSQNPQKKTVMNSSDYNALWAQVDKDEQASLPRSSAETVTKIYQKALSEKNSPQLIKSLIFKIKYGLVTDRDSFPVLLTEVEQHTEKSKNTVEQSMLYSVLAQLYFQYYQSGSYRINQRTALSGEIPGDIREWTGNIFIRRISEYTDLSLKAKKELQSTDILKYEAILNTGGASRDLRPTVYDFLANQGIELLSQLSYQRPQKFFPQTNLFDQSNFVPVADFIKKPIVHEPADLTLQALKLYQDLLSFRSGANNPDALLQANLNRLDFVYEKTTNESREQWYVDALEYLEKQYQSQDICVEVLYRKALHYSQAQEQEVTPLMKNGNIDIKKSFEGPAKAYNICNQGIRKYSDYKRISLLENLRNGLTQPYANVKSDVNVYPGKLLKIEVKYRNLSKLTVEIYRIKASVTSYENSWSMSNKYRDSGTLVETKTFSLKNEMPYIESDTVVEIPVKELGGYEYVIHAGDDRSRIANQYFSVSRLTSVSRSYDNKYEFLVVDRLSGKPVANARVNLYRKARNKNELQGSVTTGKDGLAVRPYTDNSRVDFYSVSSGGDEALVLSPVPWDGGYHPDYQNSSHLNIFTDRSIYRPGQTVYFKGIAYKQSADSSEITTNRNYTVSLRDPNGEVLSNKTLKTNEFGSFSGEFTLPYGLMNGNFTIGTDNYEGVQYFRVEEYKRPSFDIAFEPVKDTYSFGDRIKVKGEARTFSGVNMQNIRVKYRILQQKNWFWGWDRNVDNQIAEGFVQTDEKGKFEITFPAEKNFNDRSLKRLAYLYKIEASVTDEKGETQQATIHLPVGDEAMELSVPALTAPVDKDNLPEFIVFSQNFNNQEVKCSGAYEIYSLTGEESLEKYWEEGVKKDRLIASGNFTSGKQFQADILKKTVSGRYTMVIKANGNENGKEVTEEIPFLLYSRNDKQAPTTMYEWSLPPKEACNVGESTDIIFGSSAKEVYVLYEIFKENKKIQSSRFEFSNSLKNAPVIFKESYGDGIVVCITFVKDGKLFSRSFPIRKKKPDKNLELKMEVFRDKLLPGQKEEWKISVKNAENKPVDGEILAGMFDASLDKIQLHSWNFYPQMNINLYQPVNQESADMRTHQEYIYYDVPTKETPEFIFDSFNWFGLNFYEQMMTMGSGKSGRMRAYAQNQVLEEVITVADAADMKTPAPTMAKSMTGAIREESGSDNDNRAEANNSDAIRRNLNETAFFYPQLQTNKAGETLISFTVPESNTTWKLMALAHTKDLKFGQLIKEAMSLKKLMVSPNMPRFIRHGDKTSLATSISNLSEEIITGKVTITFFDPVTNQETIAVAGAKQDFSLKAGGTTTVNWTFNVPSNIDITACKIVAEAGNFSDGEQHLLPVLPNRTLVTESLPFYIFGKENKNFTMNKMAGNQSTSLKNYRLVLEFTNNPVWYAVQALPTMTTPSSENAVSWFASYYANSLAVAIANSQPEIRKVIDLWAQQAEAKETLVSNLEKNQDLKAVLLEETPWVTEAKNETEQKQQLKQLFDPNRSANLSSQAISKLKELQREDGGWAWFKGMNSSISVTQWLLYGMAQLTEMQAALPAEGLKEMQEKALSYIDEMFVKQFTDLKKYDKEWKKKTTISTYEIEYLLVKGLYPGSSTSQQAAEAIAFYTRIAELYWAKNDKLYDRAVIALLMHQAGKNTVANGIIESLRQHAKQSDELGMYWVNNDTRAFMFQSATAIHTFIMQAFEKCGVSMGELETMKLWLLKQKQTQEWESTPATVNAISALLNSGNNWLTDKGQTTVSLGNKKVDITDKEIGTGYFKKVFTPNEITPEMSKVSLSKNNDGPAWGALYWQYFEDLDKITPSKTGLNIEKSLFKEETTSSGKILVPVTTDKPLKTGDKVVVRLTVRNDRDMEYILLKDMRAACFEPVEQLSGARWKEQTVYYQTSKDASTNFYFYNLPKGTYIYEYLVYVTRPGEYSGGITTIQSMYAPEFISNAEGGKVIVSK